MTTLDDVKNILQDNKLRVTQSRIAVATVLIEQSDSLLSPEDIFNEIQETGEFHCDQVSVYRILATFLDLDLVTKGIFQGAAARYGLNKNLKRKGHKHEHFFKCNECDLIEPFSGCMFTRKEKELEKLGYAQLSHHLEITGLCPNCANA